MKKAIVAGHICLDVIPGIDHPLDLVPGRLFEVGAATLSTGGAVSNTGGAMRILGQPVKLMGKIGDDEFGRSITNLLAELGGGGEDGMIVASGVPSSYSVVVNIPGKDRIFLHCPGANHSFSSEDIDSKSLEGYSLLHFGYPPIMAKTYENGGVELERIFRKVKDAGLTSSLDMVVPDPGGPGGMADWQGIFKRVLPLVDIFLPSSDELLYVMDRRRFGEGDSLGGSELSALGSRLLEHGVAIAGVKLGSRGLYIRTGSKERLAKSGLAKPGSLDAWARRELWFPTFKVERFVGATGAGDSTIAGFLCAMLRGLSVEEAGTMANAVGACNVQAPDALSGLKGWDETLSLVHSGWARNDIEAKGEGWNFDARAGFWSGPHDRCAV